MIEVYLKEQKQRFVHLCLLWPLIQAQHDANRRCAAAWSTASQATVRAAVCARETRGLDKLKSSERKKKSHCMSGDALFNYPDISPKLATGDWLSLA